MSRLLFMILVVLITGIIAVAVLLEPTNSGIGYWFSIFWGIFLVALNWMVLVFIFSGSQTIKENTILNILSILPGIHIGVFFYSLISLFILILNQVDILSTTLNFVIQISITTVIIVVTLLSLLSAKAANLSSELTVTQKELLESLNSLQRELEDKSQIEDIINYVRYKMPHTSKLDNQKLRAILMDIMNTDMESKLRVFEARKILTL